MLFRFAVCSASLLFLGSASLSAGLVAVDNDVPREMDAGGTAGDPALYIIGDSGPVVRNFGNTETGIGTYTSYNHLIIQAGSIFTHSGEGSSIGWEGSHNQVTVTGAGSLWNITGYNGYLSVGWNGSHNRLVIENGGRVVNTSFADIGRGEESTHNSVVIRGAGSTWVTDPIDFGGGGHHTLTIEAGGRLETGTGHTWRGSYEESINNSVLVTGAGSAWFNQGGLVMDESLGNTVTIEDGGLVAMTGTGGYRLYLEPGMDSYVRLNGGFLAIYGNEVGVVAGFINAGLLQVWNGEAWVVGGLGDFTFGYYNEPDATALTGHEGLGGYTIVTAPYASLIPEPAACAALAGLGVLVLASWRRRARRD